MSATRYWVRVDHLLSDMVPGHELLVPVVILTDYLALGQEKAALEKQLADLDLDWDEYEEGDSDGSGG